MLFSTDRDVADLLHLHKGFHGPVEAAGMISVTTTLAKNVRYVSIHP